MTVVTYTYDAWGRQLSCTGSMASTLGALNPLRYRGYVYDQETNLYYLQSRYYNPELGRFINADGLVSTGQGLLGNNMFTYCLNNPVVYLDPGGTSATFFVKDAARAVLTFLTSSKYPQHDVPLYNQGNNPTCWAVCQIMVECYYNNTRLTQSDAEKKVNELVDQALGPLKAYGSGWFPLNRGRKLKIKNIYDLEKHISAGPLYAFYQGPYVDVGDGATKKGAHCVVVTGVDTQNNLVFTNTPWGNKGIQTFEQFQQGFYDANEDNHMTLQSVWEAKYVRWD